MTPSQRAETLTWDQLIDKWGLENIRVNILKPVRKDDWANKGKLIAFKPGTYRLRTKRNGQREMSTGGWDRIKAPRVKVEYNAFAWGKGAFSDWIKAEDCEFYFETKENQP